MPSWESPTARYVIGDLVSRADYVLADGVEFGEGFQI